MALAKYNVFTLLSICGYIGDLISMLNPFSTDGVFVVNNLIAFLITTFIFPNFKKFIASQF